MYLCVSRQSATEERGESSLPDKEGARLKSQLQQPLPQGERQFGGAQACLMPASLRACHFFFSTSMPRRI